MEEVTQHLESLCKAIRKELSDARDRGELKPDTFPKSEISISQCEYGWHGVEAYHVEETYKTHQDWRSAIRALLTRMASLPEYLPAEEYVKVDRMHDGQLAREAADAFLHTFARDAAMGVKTGFDPQGKVPARAKAGKSATARLQWTETPLGARTPEGAATRHIPQFAFSPQTL